ncbi:unnamed protein product [Allacma fusca]|uniref:Ionotropic receptor n=1 Tax=Allacma fusca TaxID=39272 RepID=A0A8J2KBY1_9HEXA|nr:unnamed protein product [Allacma fusca]
MKPKKLAWALHIFLICLATGSKNLLTDRLNILKMFQDCHINLIVSFDKAAQPEMIYLIRTFHLDVEIPIVLHNPIFMVGESQKIIRIRIPTKYLRFIVRKKHLSCFAYIYEQTYIDTLGLGEMHTVLVLLRSQIHKFKYNPDYILFLSERSIISPMFSLYNDFNKIGTTAIFIFIHQCQCFTSIEIYCKVCNPLKSNEEIFRKVNGTAVTRFRINEIYKTLHSDFRAEKVIHQNRVAPFKGCGYYKVKYATPLLACVQRTVAFKLNYTIVIALDGGTVHAFHYAHKPQAGAVISGWFASPDLHQHLYKYDPRGTLDQLAMGDQFYSFGFFWTVSPTLAEAGIFRAFDITTWVCIVLSITIATLSIATVRNIDIASLDALKDRTVYVDLSNETIILPNNLIFMGSKFEVGNYNLMLKIAGNKILNLEGPEISLFARRIPFILQRTVLLPPCSDALFRIVESGLWAYWAQYESAYIKLFQLKNFIQSRKGYLEQEELLVKRLIGPRKMNLVGLIWDPLPKWNPTLERLGMNIVVPVLKTLFWCLLVSFSIFLCETFIPYLQV